MRNLVGYVMIPLIAGRTSVIKRDPQIPLGDEFEFHYSPHEKEQPKITNISVKDDKISFDHEPVEKLTVVRLVIFKKI